MCTRKCLIARIDAFQAVASITDRALGLQVANNHKLVPRLRAGGSVSLATIERIEAVIEASGLLPPCDCCMKAAA